MLQIGKQVTNHPEGFFEHREQGQAGKDEWSIKRATQGCVCIETRKSNERCCRDKDHVAQSIGSHNADAGCDLLLAYTVDFIGYGAFPCMVLDHANALQDLRHQCNTCIAQSHNLMIELPKPACRYDRKG